MMRLAARTVWLSSIDTAPTSSPSSRWKATCGERTMVTPLPVMRPTPSTWTWYRSDHHHGALRGAGSFPTSSGRELLSVVLRRFPVLLATAKLAVGATDPCHVTDRVDAVAGGVPLVDHHASVDGQAR